MYEVETEDGIDFQGMNREMVDYLAKLYNFT